MGLGLGLGLGSGLGLGLGLGLGQGWLRHSQPRAPPARRGLTVTSTLAPTLTQLGAARLTEANTRALYPELLKRLDDASDSVRLKVCLRFGLG